MKKFKIAIIGISGYSGLALANILINHSAFEIKGLFSSNYAGKSLSQVHGLFTGYLNADFPLIENLDNLIENLVKKEIDCVFTATPNGVSSGLAEDLLQNNIKLIDLAADFRLQNPETFNEWYAPLKSVKSEILKQAVYGLTEWNRDKIKSAKIIANPGCYPTATALAIIPLLQNNLIDNSVFIIDAKSGTTGAGRKAEQSLLFSEVQESFSAYKPLLHRHIPEIEQTLINFGSQGHLPDIKIRFTPHLLPIKRGILNTIYLKPNPNISKNKINSLLQETLSEAYKTEFFVNIVPEPPKTKDVYGTNKCHIFATYDERTDLIVLISVIDNLIKGAAGQAIQNANLLFDLPESMGLNSLGLLP